MPELCILPPQGGVFFREDDHRYFYTGFRDSAIEMPSSSHIIALAGGKDFDKTRWRNSLMRKGVCEQEAEYYMERVRDIRATVGTRVHALIAHRGLGLPAEKREGDACRESEAIFSLWEQHVRPRIGKIFVIEKPMIHPGGCYGFTPDLVAELDGKLTLCDWKSNQAEHFAERYERLVEFLPEDAQMRSICERLAAVDASAGRVKEPTARVRDGWQMQQGSYAFGIEAVHGLRVERGSNFMLSVDGVREAAWNISDLRQGWLQFARGLLLHHQRAVLTRGHPIFARAFDAMRPLAAG